ncbi:hypothetical protein [Xenorhabdus sp. PB30.3]|uniref:hypothetical protein n=1 Tax=Xenorhabdus sp. PB30.3 TaxID=2788941 RepID=UPI001E3C9531|nr:hypothetical protein [Xenorhabdus sp. PB30.3]MCC8380460.1 hypothetical protein [Xenorhabdus sp. PB30.3]
MAESKRIELLSPLVRSNEDSNPSDSLSFTESVSSYKNVEKVDELIGKDSNQREAGTEILGASLPHNRHADYPKFEKMAVDLQSAHNFVIFDDSVDEKIELLLNAKNINELESAFVKNIVKNDVSTQKKSSGYENFEIKLLPDAHGTEHLTAVKGDTYIPVNKIESWLRGKAAGDWEGLHTRRDVLINEKRDNQSAFAKDPAKNDELEYIKENIKRLNRSRIMAVNLQTIGVYDTKENNTLIIDKLLDSTKNVTIENCKSSVVLESLNGNGYFVRINAIWKILPDGSKRLTTVTTGIFKE